MSCTCVTQLNKQLEEAGENTRISTQMVMNFENGTTEIFPVIQTEKRNSSKREAKKTLFATYCPFCGKKYKEER